VEPIRDKKAIERIKKQRTYIPQVRDFLKCISISSLRGSSEKSEASP
jgi:hypothetical protein